VITDLLAGTNWQARFVGETTAHSTNFYYISTFDALKKVCDVWDLEMQFFVEMNGNRIGGRYIDFKQRIGEAVGKRVVYGHNALQILQEVERTNIFTALVGRGKGEETGDGYGRKITFENVVWSTTQGKPVNKPAGQKYLELPLMTREYGIKNADGSMRPKIGFVDFSEEDNPEVLIERTYKALVDTARPQLTLKTSSVYLKGVSIGDTIRVVRHDKKLDYDTRIFEITFNRLNNQSSDIKLGDRIGESNEAKAQTIADKAVESFVANEFSNFVQNLPDYLPSADGFNNNWYGAEDPTVQYPGKVLINDIWYKSDPEHEGHKIMLRWTGEVWEEILRTYESEALRDRIAEEIAQVNQSMQAQSEEHDRQVADILSKTQSVEELANQAKTDAVNAINGALEAKQLAQTAGGQISQVQLAVDEANRQILQRVTKAELNPITQRLSSAETTILTQAGQIGQRLTSTQVESAITSKGYITSSALQPYALSTTVQNLVKETADSFSRTISETKALIPTSVGGRNLAQNTSSDWSTPYTSFSGSTNTCPQLYKVLVDDLAVGDTLKSRIVLKYTDIVPASGQTARIWLQGDGNVTGWKVGSYNGSTYKPISGSGEMVFEHEFKITSDHLKNQFWNLMFRTDYIASGSLQWKLTKVEKGPLWTAWSPAPKDFATVTALHAVNDTVDSHTRTIGAVGTSGSILDNVSKVTQTAAGLVQEVSGDNGLKTQVSTLAGSYAIKNLTKAGDVLGQINLNPDGSVRINEGLISVGTKTYIQDGVISSAKIANLDAGKITTGTLNAARIAVNSIDGSKLVFDQAFVNKMTANEALFKQLFAQRAFITSVQSTNISADVIKGGLLKSSNGATNFDLNNGNLLFNNNYGYIRRTANDKIFEITTLLTEKSDYSPEGLSSKFMIRKSDSSRQSGVSFNLYTTVNGKPTATTQIYSDSFTITSSDYTTLFSLGSKNSYLGTLNLQKWGDIPVAVMSGGLVVKDIGIGGHIESLLKVVERLCSKTGLMWI
jgi:phage minor structural protein